MDGPLTFGFAEHLQFELRWEASNPSGSAADATRGGLVARIAGRAIWGNDAQPFTWTWIELVEHLARYWSYAFIEEGDPLALGVAPERLRVKAEERLANMIEEHRAHEEELLWSYLHAHDLASGVDGAFPASLWLTREGNQMRVACKEVVRRMPVVEAREMLSALGDAIIARVEHLEDARAKLAKVNWAARETVDSMQLAQIVTGRESEAIQTIAPYVPTSFNKLRFENAFHPDEYLAVARMTNGVLTATELSPLFAAMQAQPQVWTRDLDKLAEQATSLVASIQAKRAFEQGRAVARWFREQLNLADEDRFEPQEKLDDWKIPVVDVRLPTSALDAVSFWAPKHGPAIIVNKNGHHSRMNPLRATLAHEIGHLLLDRTGALPVAEVMGGRMSSHVEMRARAFAAELLVPERVAGQAISGVQNQKDLKGVVLRLVEFYGASREIVAWQAYNAHDRQLPQATASFLRSLVSNPQAF